MSVKVKLGTTEKEDIQRVKKVREAIGEDLPIRIDANQGWDYKTAANVLQALESEGIEYCEQPVAYWDYENMRHIWFLPGPIFVMQTWMDICS